MLVDTSALIAILLGETDATRLVEAVAGAERRLLAAPSLVEASAVMRARKGPQGEIALDALLQRLRVETVPMTVEAADHARAAYARFGKGVGDPAVLNFGDCLCYGVARALNEPLLFKGDDFSQTDIEAVL